MRVDLLNSVRSMKTTDVVFVPASVLLAAGADTAKLDGIPDDRPVPVLVSDVKKLCGESDGEEPVQRQQGTDLDSQDDCEDSSGTEGEV